MSESRRIMHQDVGRLLNDIDRLEHIVNNFDILVIENGCSHISLAKYKRLMALQKVLGDWKDMTGLDMRRRK